MTLLLYGILGADGDAPLAEGLDGRQLRPVVERGLLAAVGDHDGPGPAPTAAALGAYERVVRRLTGLGAILPARFGSLLQDESAVRELLRRRDDLPARLREVRGAVEIGLRATWRSGDGADAPSRSEASASARPDAEPRSGTAYLEARLKLRRRAGQVAAELDPLAGIARTSRRAPAPGFPMRDAYLVDRRRIHEFVALVARLDLRLDDVELVCTGPWPPYSFAQGAPV